MPARLQPFARVRAFAASRVQDDCTREHDTNPHAEHHFGNGILVLSSLSADFAASAEGRGGESVELPPNLVAQADLTQHHPSIRPHSLPQVTFVRPLRRIIRSDLNPKNSLFHRPRRRWPRPDRQRSRQPRKANRQVARQANPQTEVVRDRPVSPTGRRCLKSTARRHDPGVGYQREQRVPFL